MRAMHAFAIVLKNVATRAEFDGFSDTFRTALNLDWWSHNIDNNSEFPECFRISARSSN